MEILGRFLSLKASCSKTIKDIITILSFDNVIGSILRKFHVTQMKVVGEDTFGVGENRFYGGIAL